jgi:hypothetical protein
MKTRARGCKYERERSLSTQSQSLSLKRSISRVEVDVGGCGYGGEEVVDGGLKRFRLQRASSLETSVFI